MLMQESFQSHDVPPKERLRKTMLHQEIIFRNQVEELHRLYSMQKMLMGDIGLKQLHSCTQLPWSFYSHNPVTRESSASLIENAKLSSTVMLGSPLTKSQVLRDRQNSAYNNSIDLEPLNLQMCSDQCATHVDQEALNLSLSVVREDKRIQATASNCFDQKINSGTRKIIDLEVSMEGISNEEGNCAACSTTFATMTKCEPQVSVHSGMMENTGCPLDEGEYYPGLQGCHKAMMVHKSSLKNCVSHEAGKLDLNQVQLDDPSGHSSDNLVNSHSTANSVHIFGVSFDRTPETAHPSATWRKENSKSQYDASDIFRWDDDINSVGMNSNYVSEIHDPKCKTMKECEAALIGNNKPVVRTQMVPCNDLRDCMSGPENKYVGSICQLSCGQFTYPDDTYMVNKMVNCDNTKDDEISCACQSPTEEKYEDGDIRPVLCESSCVGIMKTRQPQINLGGSNPVIPDQHLGADDLIEAEHACPKKVELPEMSMCIQTAAQLLINFSISCSSSYQACSSKAVSIKVDKKEMEKLECSDSFEQIVLKLEECNADDYSVSSKPYEIDSTEKKDFSSRLKRGRRYKDFQKEILPGLASLSGHEIQEDINILEAILRSREYRKIRGRMGDQSSWCAPARSRRSKRSNVRRKIFHQSSSMC